MEQTSQKNYGSALYTLVMVFFFWGFLAASNGIFIPFCKTYFNLSQFESQLIDSAFYGAYFIGSLILYLASTGIGYDILNKIGFKKGIIYGLLISVVGAGLMIPAVNSGSYGFILGAFFIIALGFSLQQTAANPFAIALGDPRTGAHRLSLAGGVNSFGTTIGPIIVTLVLFGTVIATPEQVESAGIGSINLLYIILIVVFLLVAGIFAVAKMPNVQSDEEFEKTGKATKAM
ncbi:MAG TPA: MFS transporter [Pelobium sp.]|nr:MFS transporter [Pelobium sp.]